MAADASFKAKSRRRLEDLWALDTTTRAGQGAEDYEPLKPLFGQEEKRLSYGFASATIRFAEEALRERKNKKKAEEEASLLFATSLIEGPGPLQGTTTSAFRASSRRALYEVPAPETPRVLPPRRFETMFDKADDDYDPPPEFKVRESTSCFASSVPRLPRATSNTVGPGSFDVDRWHASNREAAQTRPSSCFASTKKRELWALGRPDRRWPFDAAHIEYETEPLVKKKYELNAFFMPGPPRSTEDLDLLKREYKLSSKKMMMSKSAEFILPLKEKKKSTVRFGDAPTPHQRQHDEEEDDLPADVTIDPPSLDETVLPCGFVTPDGQIRAY